MKSPCVDILPCSFEREGHVKNIIMALEKWHLILLDQKKKQFLVR